MRKFLAVPFAMLLLGGCSTSIGTLTFASTDVVAQPSQPGMRVTGADCGDKFLFIPIGSPANVAIATERALAQAPGATVLTDTAVWNDYMITVLYNRDCWRVVGNAVADGRTEPHALEE